MFQQDKPTLLPTVSMQTIWLDTNSTAITTAETEDVPAPCVHCAITTWISVTSTTSPWSESSRDTRGFRVNLPHKFVNISEEPSHLSDHTSATISHPSESQKGILSCPWSARCNISTIKGPHMVWSGLPHRIKVHMLMRVAVAKSAS